MKNTKCGTSGISEGVEARAAGVRGGQINILVKKKMGFSALQHFFKIF
jgi:hypothetical protein